MAGSLANRRNVTEAPTSARAASVLDQKFAGSTGQAQRELLIHKAHWKQSPSSVLIDSEVRQSLPYALANFGIGTLVGGHLVIRLLRRRRFHHENHGQHQKRRDRHPAEHIVIAHHGALAGHLGVQHLQAGKG